MYIIKDWAGNILTYKGYFEKPCFAVAMEFESFDDAIEYVVTEFAEDFFESQDCYVESVKERN